MKHAFALVLLMSLAMAVGIAFGSHDESALSGGREGVQPNRVIPIAPGVWYPQDGPVPEKPVRYYRVRCWPGCHKGSTYGKYPDQPLNMRPIYPTSTIQSHTPSSEQ